MNGKKAKRIRSEVYGDNSLREKREYKRLRNQFDPWQGRFVQGTIINKHGSLRDKYQRAKRSA
jgi:hypothetical protein